MKKLLIFSLCLSFFSISGQRIKSIGIDLGDNIVPLLMGYEGFTGSVLMKAANKNDKIVEYKLGYASLRRDNIKIQGSSISGTFMQKSEGFYLSIGKNVNKNFGWHVTASVFNLGTTAFVKDTDFDVIYQYGFPTEPIFATGGDLFYEFPIKITSRCHTNIRLVVSASISSSPKNAPSPSFRPGFFPPPPNFLMFGGGLSIPFFFDLQK